jgi:hypothetical protein
MGSIKITPGIPGRVADIIAKIDQNEKKYSVVGFLG